VNSVAKTSLDLQAFATPPTQMVTASSGWSAVNVREIWQFRELLLTLAGRDVRVRYKQTALGAIWVVFQPLLAAGIFSFVFTLVAGLDAPGGLPYFLFTFTSLLAWNAFANVLNRSSGAMVANAPLVAKVYFPRMIMPLATLFTTLVDFMVALALLAVILPIFWHYPGWNVLLMPAILLLLLTLAMGVGLCASATAVIYRDALYVLPVLAQFLMWVSAVLFPTEEVPERYLHLFYLNPVVSQIEAFRWSLLGAGQVHWGYLAYSAIVTLVVFFCGAMAFRRMERRFADVI
jgi:lipopolysaccharide transport system permease protein